jgi:type I restriction enzyme S subunit
VPEGWERATIADIGLVVTGKTPSKKKESNYGGDVPLIKTPDMHGNTLVIETEESLSKEGANTQSNKTLPPRSILVSCIGTVGVVSFNCSEAQTNQQINAIVPTDENIRYWTFFMAQDLKPLLEGMGGGATMANVSKSKFSNIKVAIPPSLILNQFNSYVVRNINQIETLAKMNLKLTQARDYLLPRLMNGEIAV